VNTPRELNMATEVLTKPRASVGDTLFSTNKPASHVVTTSLNYYDDPGDGTPPMPVVIGK